MVYSFTASPFADAAQATQFAAVEAALRADADPNALLLGNLVLADDTAPIDALVVRPHSITLLVLVPRGGRLSIPALGYGSWQLDGLPLPGPEDFDNPHEQAAQQKGALQSWLSRRFSPEQANLQRLSSVVLFGAPVVFGPDVEPALASATVGFQLLSDTAGLPDRLRQLASPEIDLSADDLAEWAAEWTAFAAQPPAAAPVPADDAPLDAAAAGNFLGKQARAIWGWLGAADVPDDDPPYGYAAPDVAARNEEKQQLEQLRLQMQADLSQQLQALEAREAERERSIGQLRAELAQAPTVASEATALVSRLSAETRAKAALEAEMQASKAESIARNKELDGKIQQLNQLIDQLSVRSAAVGAPPAADPAPQVEPRAAAAATAPPMAASVAQAAPAAGPPLPAAAPPAVLSAQPSVTIAPPAAAAMPVAASAPAAKPFEWPPLLRQLGQRAQHLPRAGVLAAGAGVLGLAVLLFSQRGSDAPVPFQENGRWGYADASGQPVVPAQYAAASPFLAGQAVVAKDGAYGFVNEEGKEVVPLAYDALNPYAGGFARARVGDAYTFIDADGQEFDHYYFNALDFAEGHAAVLDHRGWHYISGPAAPATAPPIFAEAYSFADGLARVKLPDGYAYITADYLADPSRGTKPFGRYTLAADFADGKARVTQGGRSFTIDKDGEEVK